MYVEMFPTFIDAGAVEDLTPYLTQEDYDHYLVLTDQHKIFGKHYGIPKAGKSSAVSLWYNKDILDEIGEEPPKNWKDIRRIVEKVQKDKENGGPKDRIGLAQGWGQNFYQDLNWNWYQFLWQNNTDMWDDDGKCIIDSKEGLEAAQFVYDMKFKYDALPEDTMSLTNTEAFDKYFMTGKAALAYAGANKGRFHDLDNSSTPFDYGFTIAIKGDEGGGGFFSAQDQAVLMSKCKDKELGMDFLRYITGGAGAEYVHKALNQGPTFKGEEYYGLEQTKEEIEKHGEEFARPIKAARRAPEVYDYLWKKLQDMMNGNMDPKATMEDVTNFANELDYKDPEK